MLKSALNSPESTILPLFAGINMLSPFLTLTAVLPAVILPLPSRIRTDKNEFSSQLYSYLPLRLNELHP